MNDDWESAGDEDDPHAAVYRPADEDGAAFLDPAGAGMQHVLNFYFPVYIEAVGALGDGQMERIAGYIFDALDDALRAQA